MRERPSPRPPGYLKNRMSKEYSSDRNPTPLLPMERITFLDFFVGLFLFIMLPSLAFALGTVLGERVSSKPSESRSVLSSPQETSSRNPSEETNPLSNDSSAPDNSAPDSKFSQGSSDSTNSDHAVVNMMRQNKSIKIFLLLFIMGCILAPLNEELLFRGTLQQSLENTFGVNSQPRFPLSIQGWASIIISAILFALIHLRYNSTPNIEKLTIQVKWTVAGQVFFAPLFLLWLRFCHQIHLSDVFGSASDWIKSAKSGAFAFAVLLLPVYFVQAFFATLFFYFQIPFCPDPFALFVLTMGLGWLFYRHRTITASITLHFLFNSISLTAAYFMV